MDKSASADKVKSMRFSEESRTEHKLFENIPYDGHADSTLDIILPDEFQGRPVTPTDRTAADRLRKLFDHCVQQVSHLETQRKQHIQELLSLHEPMLGELEILRRELQETQRMLSVAQLRHAAALEEVERVRRKLFAAARDCIHSQVTLETQKYEVAQSVITRVSNPLSDRDCLT